MWRIWKWNGGQININQTTNNLRRYHIFLLILITFHSKVDLPPPVHFSKCTTRFPYKTYGVRKRNLGKSSINRQIQKYVANHNKDGPKTKLKMKKFLTALSSVLYFMFYFPPYVLYGKRVVHFEKWTGALAGHESSDSTLQYKILCTVKYWPFQEKKKRVWRLASGLTEKRVVHELLST